jgi:hypothetical protein
MIWPVVIKAQRTCTVCKTGFPDSNFFLNSNRRLRSVCKKCYQARAQEWKRANKDRVNQQRRAARQKQRSRASESHPVQN